METFVTCQLFKIQVNLTTWQYLCSQKSQQLQKLGILSPIQAVKINNCIKFFQEVNKTIKMYQQSNFQISLIISQSKNLYKPYKWRILTFFQKFQTFLHDSHMQHFPKLPINDISLTNGGLFTSEPQDQDFLQTQRFLQYLRRHISLLKNKN